MTITIELKLMKKEIVKQQCILPIDKGLIIFATKTISSSSSSSKLTMQLLEEYNQEKLPETSTKLKFQSTIATASKPLQVLRIRV